jgi:hypothetical protein
MKLPAPETDYWSGISWAAKFVELTPCGHRSEKNSISTAKVKEQKQNLKQCKQLRKHYLQTEKQKKKMLQAINQIPLDVSHEEKSHNHGLKVIVQKNVVSFHGLNSYVSSHSIDIIDIANRHECNGPYWKYAESEKAFFGQQHNPYTPLQMEMINEYAQIIWMLTLIHNLFSSCQYGYFWQSCWYSCWFTWEYIFKHIFLCLYALKSSRDLFWKKIALI